MQSSQLAAPSSQLPSDPPKLFKQSTGSETKLARSKASLGGPGEGLGGPGGSLGGIFGGPGGSFSGLPPILPSKPPSISGSSGSCCSGGSSGSDCSSGSSSSRSFRKLSVQKMHDLKRRFVFEMYPKLS